MATLVGFQMLAEPANNMNLHGEEQPNSTPGPFRATKMWNAIVDHLKTAVDVRTRKHMMRSYEDCFLGSDAVDVICDYLERENSDVKDVTREKIAKLCQYFLDQNIMEDAQAFWNIGHKRAVFMDSNSQYYRFTSKDSNEESLSEERTALQTESIDFSPSNKSKACKRRASIDMLQQPFDRKRRIRHSIGLGRTAKFDRRASLAEGRSSNMKGIQNPAFEDPHSKALTAIVTPTRQPLASRNLQDCAATPGLKSFGRESRRERKLSKQVISEIWKEVIIQRILHLVELPHLDNLLACAASYHYESAEHVEKSMPNLNTPAKRMSSRRNVQRPDVNNIDPWLRAAIHCLDAHPDGNNLKRDFCSSRTHTAGMLHARKLLLFQTIVKLYTDGRKEPLITPLLMDIVTTILGALGGGKGSRAIELTQLCLLLLPGATRLRLRALLRFMGEAGKKSSIRLAYQVDNRTNVCNTLQEAIISSPLLSAVQAKNLVSFFLDTQNKIFKVPEAVLQAVTTRVAQAKQGEQDHCRVVFCQMVTTEQFEVEDQYYTKEALRNLMNTIIDNTKLSLKEKKQKLKMLQKAHPDIYNKHFADML
ncbi:DEP domain-containing protein 7 [Strongylocentrotus purpuratus]|uniref:DEP domain-containing protein n=1 Tax=Strongylocentrotus purpuratus TaxID=7668 RepID=A0A7M7T0A8_STRPU|nr:DEP domain-containing protein 7 [Strongylocentrotus purpuratus]